MLNKKVWKNILIMALIIVGICSLSSCGKKKVKLKDYVEVKFEENLNGEGKATYIFRTSDFLTDTLDEGKLPKDPDAISDPKLREKVANIRDAIDYKIDKDENLSNGDKVKITFNVDKKTLAKYDLEADDSPIEFEVKGLTEYVSNYEDITPEIFENMQTSDKVVEDYFKSTNYWQAVAWALPVGKDNEYRKNFESHSLFSWGYEDPSEEDMSQVKTEIEHVKNVFVTKKDNNTNLLEENILYYMYKVTLTDKYITEPFEFYVLTTLDGTIQKKDGNIIFKENNSIDKELVQMAGELDSGKLKALGGETPEKTIENLKEDILSPNSYKYEEVMVDVQK